MTQPSSWSWPTPSGLPPLAVPAGILGFLALLSAAAPVVEIDPVRLLGSFGKMAVFGSQLFAMPDWDYVPQLLDKMLETIEMTFLATCIAAAISLPLGVLAARNATPHPFVYHATRNVLSLMRALPDLVWALVFVSAVGLGPLPGVMALAFVTVGFMAKFFAEAIEVVAQGPVEGVKATGAGLLQVRAFAMLPQALPDFVGSTLYILDHNLRAAAILGLVGAGGIGYDLVMSMRLFQYDRLPLIALSIYLVVTLLDRLSDHFRRGIILGARA